MPKKPISESLDLLAAWLRAHDDIAVCCHISPDGDAAGSALALTRLLRSMGKRAFPLCRDAIPRMYAFLPDVGEFVTADSMPFAPKAELFCDVSDPSRADGCLLSCESALLDHHETNPAFTQVNAIDGNASATGVLVLELAERMGLAIDKETATDLYVAITTDTGNFSYRSTDGRTLRAGAKCLDAGADPDTLTRLLFRLRTVPRTKLLGAAICEMHLVCGGKAAILPVPLAMREKLGASTADCESIVNYGIETEGVAVAALLREQSDGVKLSLRSLGEVDVSRIAVKYGGGGHRAAAGCTLCMSMEESMTVITREFEALFS